MASPVYMKENCMFLLFSWLCGFCLHVLLLVLLLSASMIVVGVLVDIHLWFCWCCTGSFRCLFHASVWCVVSGLYNDLLEVHYVGPWSFYMWLWVSRQALQTHLGFV